ncbi:MAG: Ig-like domain-containing protein [Candidatus Koribacter versatilis]|nr:Ig-like domain-containing protein [Candidatus Koribacter versatilis]
MHMFTGRKLPLTLAFVVLIGLAFGASCKGFFVDPTLTSIAVTPPTPQVQEGKTTPLTATGTYDDNSRKNITKTATWTSSNQAIATVDSSGVVSGVTAGSASISASAAGLSGSTTVTVTLADLLSIHITPENASIPQSTDQQYQAIGTFSNGTRDITTQVTWKSSNTVVATIDAAGLATAKSVTQNQTTNITATSGTVVSNTAVLTVTP